MLGIPVITREIAKIWLFGLTWELSKPTGLTDGWTKRNRELWATAIQSGSHGSSRISFVWGKRLALNVEHKLYR